MREHIAQGIVSSHISGALLKCAFQTAYRVCIFADLQRRQRAVVKRLWEIRSKMDCEHESVSCVIETPFFEITKAEIIVGVCIIVPVS